MENGEHGDLISIYVLPNKENKNQLGIAVSKKFSKSSVKRNRIKRLIKEVYRLNESSIKLGNSIVILWKNKANYENANFSNISNDFFKCLNKIKILVKEEECNA